MIFKLSLCQNYSSNIVVFLLTTCVECSRISELRMLGINLHLFKRCNYVISAGFISYFKCSLYLVQFNEVKLEIYVSFKLPSLFYIYQGYIYICDMLEFYNITKFIVFLNFIYISFLFILQSFVLCIPSIGCGNNSVSPVRHV